MHAYVGMGGNVGDVRAAFERAVTAMAALPFVEEVRLSSLWLTAPVGPVPDQPPFLNRVAELRLAGAVSPRGLMEELLRIERALGRDREHETPQGPRPIDLDLLLIDAVTSEDPVARLPHPRMAERAFVLLPLGELVGDDFVIPGAGRLGDRLAEVLTSQPSGWSRTRS